MNILQIFDIWREPTNQTKLRFWVYS